MLNGFAESVRPIRRVSHKRLQVPATRSKSSRSAR
jgi:hypothetical protein